MTWRATGLLTIAVLVLRIAHLLLCPYELLGDEAYYWQWSRHLGPGYCEKGPGIAWTIAASTASFGTSEATVRLPMAIASALATLGLAGLASACSGGDPRVGFLAAALFTLMPAYQGNALVCTPDGPLIALWIAGSWVAQSLSRALERGHFAPGPWLLFGAVVGLGFLFKQSMLLLPAGWLMHLLTRRRQVWWNAALTGGAALSAATCALVVSPVLAWNVQHGWATLAHTLGHLGAPGGDLSLEGEPARRYNPLWTLSLLGAQLGAFGPPAILLIVWSIIRAFRARRDGRPEWSSQSLMIWLSVPSLVLCTALTFWKKVEANWPFPAFATLLVPVARLAVQELPLCRERLRAWRSAASQFPCGPVPPRPPTWFRTVWVSMVIYGVAGCLLLWFLPAVWLRVDWPGKPSIVSQRAKAARLDELRRAVELRTGQSPLLIAAHYMPASLYAFYLPDRPVVFNGRSQLGGRRSAYDFWPDTDLSDPQRLGRPALLFGTHPDRWKVALRFASVESLDETLPAYLGQGYGGPVAANAHAR